ncbi:hypothetical protein ABZ816_13160 [Actinosynnema sp. NPDC047251]|uniref:ESX-1 secretion-associated protein n=1 Tax=Saccharothrix espanaensis (strain ATCC 51144 / DSM 44229 / JCM 9112 / NBRC 15066 / NRRL 15764) TaxID=1179773 RepID=K0KBF5_SACES|nr:hypothetical protein [Saccharothrix espanaensis]CCH35546.1 hypothetical protein BN6_83290 [Saccharothrix espanaensis DSM 44229]
MGEGFKVEPAELHGYGELLTRNAQHFLTIKDHAVTKGGDTSGFTGLLTLLQPVVTGVAGLYGETLDFANQMMTKEAGALTKAADMYAQGDEMAMSILDQVLAKLAEAAQAPTLGGGR